LEFLAAWFWECAEFKAYFCVVVFFSFEPLKLAFLPNSKTQSVKFHHLHYLNYYGLRFCLRVAVDAVGVLAFSAKIAAPSY
jgi:hypothetical protein